MMILLAPLLMQAICCTAFLSPSSRGNQLHTLRMGIIDDLVTQKKGGALSSYNALEILEQIGSGSYGVVHLTKLIPKNNDSSESLPKNCVAKRAWTLEELQDKNTNNEVSDTELRELSKRCKYYLDVEQHCLEKLGRDQDDKDNNFRYVPKLLGEYPDNEGRGDWLVFDLVESSNSGTGEPAKTLTDVLELDWIDQHEQDDADPSAHHHLYMLQKELSMAEESTFADVLDKTLLQLFRTISHVNGANIVHRDIKPGNLLVTSNGFVLIDFGSAADLDPPSKASFSSILGGGGERVGLDDGRVALSPIYCAPETYIKLHRSPVNFDSFSTALVFCQLLFNLLDERSDASFRGQLEDVDYDLDLWLQREINAELRPEGIEDAIKYLASRPGLWSVLRAMLHPDPERRLSTSDALARVNALFAAVEADNAAGVDNEVDGKFFAGILKTFESCELPDEGTAIGVPTMEKEAAAASVPAVSSVAEMALVMPYPLHYVATFSRSKSLGLILSEVDPEGKYEDELGEEDDKLWRDATANAQPGEVYIRGVVEGSQAATMGIFDVGDRVMGVGEFPFIAEGFDTVVEMLQRQPPSAKSVTLHFDRKSRGRLHAYETAPVHSAKVVGQGAWSACGRRKYQEDRFGESV
jgi:serine/threonine protein kinase